MEPAFAVKGTPVYFRINTTPGTTELTLVWNIPADGAPTGYRIYRASPIHNTLYQFGPYSLEFDNSTNIAGPSIQYRNATMLPGEPFSWYVVSYDNTGEGIPTPTLGVGTFDNSGNIDSAQQCLTP